MSISKVIHVSHAKRGLFSDNRREEWEGGREGERWVDLVSIKKITKQAIVWRERDGLI
jgi:hypothetical protein